MCRFNRIRYERAGIDMDTIGINSPGISRIGEREGVEMGYNPKWHGRSPLHALVAFSS